MKYKFSITLEGEQLWCVCHTNELTDGYTQNEDDATIYDSENMIDAEEIDNCMNYCSYFIEAHSVE